MGTVRKLPQAPPSNVDAVRAEVAALQAEGLLAAHSDSLQAAAVTLAKALDDGAGLSTAAVARELRATMAALRQVVTDEPDGLEFLAELSAPVLDAADKPAKSRRARSADR